MDHFVDIRLQPDPEIAAHHLLGALYAKLHRALVVQRSNGVAASFPGYQTNPLTLGICLRLLGSKPALDGLAQTDWLSGMRDHVTVGAVAQVPADATHRALRRVQAKSSPERLRRRLIKRHGLDEAQARERIPDSAAQTLHLPFVQLRSNSTGQTFPLFLSLGKAQAVPLPGEFNAYGLSQRATTPWF